MTYKRLLRFLLSYAAVGIVVAASVSILAPELIAPRQPGTDTSGASPGEALPEYGRVSYAQAVERAAPAVVNIHTAKRVTERVHPLMDDPVFRRFFGNLPGWQTRERVETSLGSGVIVTPQGHVLTNNHVIQGADQIQIMLNDGRTAVAKLVGADPETDLAVLSTELEDLPAVTVGRSDSLRVGDVVLAIGNPFGVGQTVTQGIVSATGRKRLGLNTFENFIQTDAAINPGNSGGALINARGELIGINTAIFSRSGGSHGIGFAIPVALAQDVLSDIVQHGRVVRGWIGVEVQALTPQLAASLDLPPDIAGILLSGVQEGGPADRAGLIPGDIIQSIDGVDASNGYAMLRLISARNPGSHVSVQALRGRRVIDVEVEVEERLKPSR